MLPILFGTIEAAAHAAAAEPGLIEKFGIEPKLVVLQIISFLIFFSVVYFFGIKPTIKTIDERNKTIADGLRFSNESKAKLAEAEKQHAEVLRKAALEAQKIVEDSRLAAKDLFDRETKLATERTQQILAKAEESIALERRKVLDDARREISRLVALTAQRVLDRELSADERTRYSESAARELNRI